MSEVVIRRRVVAADESIDGLHPVLSRVYRARGVGSRADIDHRLARMHAPQSLGGMRTACALLVEALRGEQRIVVVGDFDADGATGTAVAVRGLRLLGAAQVDFRVPHRMRHGYGLSPALVEELRDPAPHLILTVDNGVASHAGVAAAGARGIRVLITDHHLPGPTLPAADAMVNPNLDGDPFPSKALAGVGVMFYLLLGLRAQLREQGWFNPARPEPDLSSLLDLVAVGTVADLVPLDYNNRILVAAGLKRIRAGSACAGVGALLAVSGRDCSRISASDLGFSVAPRINAAGRLEDMQIGIECLICDDPGRARALAERLDGINAERRELQTAMVDDAELLVAQKLQAVSDLDVGICLFDPSWHPGVVGLVASKLKEKLNRPVIAFAPAGDDAALLRGSARSIAGFHVRDALAAIDAAEPGLIERFGGHAMAAGMSLRSDRLAQFAAAFDGEARRLLGDSIGASVLWSDGGLSGAEANHELAQMLADAGPWGQAFAEPLFDNQFEVGAARVVGDRHLKMKLRFAACGSTIDAIQFNAPKLSASGTIHAAYQLAINEWRGERTAQLIVRHMVAL